MCLGNLSATKIHYDKITNSTNYNLPDDMQILINDYTYTLELINFATDDCVSGLSLVLATGPGALSAAKAAGKEQALAAKAQAGQAA